MLNIVFLSRREKIFAKEGTVAIEIMQAFLVENICFEQKNFCKDMQRMDDC
jgi:hypothetical protein